MLEWCNPGLTREYQMKHFYFLMFFIISTQAFCDEKSLYNFSWLDSDKEVYVLQNRKFRKVDSLYVSLLGVKTLSGAFVDSYGGSLRLGYFFKEDWGLEFAYGKNSFSENDTAKGVKEAGTIPYYRGVDNYLTGMLMWSPFYSKINTFNNIFYYDWMFGLGLARVTTLNNGAELLSSDGGLTSHEEIGISWNTGLRFYISESWSLRLDFTGLHYQAEKTRQIEADSSTKKTKQLFSHYDLGIGLNYTF
jgi:outer membrane beta-barrel protein